MQLNLKNAIFAPKHKKPFKSVLLKPTVILKMAKFYLCALACYKLRASTATFLEVTSPSRAHSPELVMV